GLGGHASCTHAQEAEEPIERRQDDGERVALLIRALLIGAGAGVLLIAGQSALFAGAFWLSPATPEVEGLARTYLSIRIWSAPAAIALYGITGWLIAQERTTEVLILQILMNGVNIALDLVFVLGLGFGVEGVAVASLIAEWSGLALGLWFCRRAFHGSAWSDTARILDPARLRQMATVNGDILIRSVLLQGTFLTFVFQSADVGTVTLAANQVLLQFLYVTSYALDGFAFAAEALVGQAFGARNPATLRRAVWLAGLWCVGVSAGIALLYWFAGPPLIDLLTTAPDVRETARDFLPWVVLSPLLGVWPFLLDGVFIGATRTRDMRNMMVLSTAVYGVALLALAPVFGNHGLWMALMISFIARGATLAWRYPDLERAADR
ncbi:MAG: MATE family efflux transporter, partial [Pseudomonadota bacterium]